MTNRLLETKFHTPLWRSEGVIRQRLLDQLHTGLREQRKLSLVSAPAGYGKTSLISSWVHSLKESTPHIWLSLESSDDHPARFLAYWLTAWNRVSDFDLGPLLDLLNEPQLPPFQSILDILINAPAGLKNPVVFVLDDYHVITTPLIHEILDYFIEHQPHLAHMVIITRSDPLLPLPRLRAHGQMVEIRANQLRFLVEEASHFFNQSMHLGLV